jgi:polysaccharide export outer membrane protein
MQRFAFLPLVLLVSACGTSQQVAPNLPRGAAAYNLMPAAGPSTVAGADYRIGPFDSVEISVFGEPDLSAKGQQVDSTGLLTLPLVGAIPAAGKTAYELGREVERVFAQKYLRNPQVTVTVDKSVSQKVTVQGEVSAPGVYELKGPTTLLETLSLAKGEQRSAKLDQVVVFRTIKGQRMGAVFDVKQIRAGVANDPQILGNDVVVVGYSEARRFWEDIRTALPLFNVFRPVTMGVIN